MRDMPQVKIHKKDLSKWSLYNEHLETFTD